MCREFNHKEEEPGPFFLQTCACVGPVRYLMTMLHSIDVAPNCCFLEFRNGDGRIEMAVIARRREVWWQCMVQ